MYIVGENERKLTKVIIDFLLSQFQRLSYYRMNAVVLVVALENIAYIKLLGNWKNMCKFAIIMTKLRLHFLAPASNNDH